MAILIISSLLILVLLSVRTNTDDYNAVSTETITEGSPVTPVTDITNTHLSSEKWLYVIYFSVFVVALILAVPLMSRGLKKFLEDEDTMTTVIYEEADKSSVQD